MKIVVTHNDTQIIIDEDQEVSTIKYNVKDIKEILESITTQITTLNDTNNPTR